MERVKQGTKMAGLNTVLAYSHHIGTVSLMLSLIATFIFLSLGLPSQSEENGTFDPFEEYGTIPTIILYIFRLLQFAPIPITLANFIGVLCFNTYPSNPKLMTSTLFGPFICFRVVTKGTYPDLVHRNVQRNIEICNRINLDNYIFEVVTDNFINLGKIGPVRELVVPATYATSRGSLFKARALNYCLEDGVNVLNENDWIVHLDEETILTEASVVGIVNFINSSTYEFGQGVITYANEEIVSWITTLADLVRVGMDHGIVRFSLGLCHRPVFSWKGSFIVANAAAERKITFDFGPEGSIAEDCYFALTAWKEGYSFGLVEGQMWEKSTFSMRDYVQQRKRWFKGISLTFLSSRIPLQYKLGIGCMVFAYIAMPFSCTNIILISFYPLPMPWCLNILCGFMGGVVIFLFILGVMKSFSLKKLGKIKFLFLCISPVFIAPISMVLETVGVCLAFKDVHKSEFHIVKKEIHRGGIISEV